MIGRTVRALRWLMPDSIGGQVVLLLIVSVMAMNGAATTLFYLDSAAGVRRPPADVSGELALALRTLDGLAPEARAAALAALNQANGGFTLATVPASGGPAPSRGALPGERDAGRLLARDLPATVAVHRRPPGAEGDPAGYTITLTDGTGVEATVPMRARSFFFGPTLFTVVFLAIGLLLFGTWSVRVMTAPLRRFVGAVEAFGGGVAAPPLPEAGPREVRAVIGAFNRMQQRITRLLDDNARMLAAVSHDLRTPITRLRLRAEFIDDDAMRAAMLADLAHVSALTADALAWLDGSREGPKRVRVDLASLVEATVDQFADLDRPVSYVGPERMTVLGRPNDLQRALRNLIENGLTYAGAVEVRLETGPDGWARIAVLDHGPGIPPADRERLQQPFERADEARTQDGSSGFGLGLSIARAVAEAHGGRLDLLERQPQGLAAVIVIPFGLEPAAAG